MHIICCSSFRHGNAKINSINNNNSDKYMNISDTCYINSYYFKQLITYPIHLLYLIYQTQ